ncbi:MAG TPA: hypothetical protein VMZ25_01105 [Terriglobales bacterium]|nr:hypothetical protein [Terriglobales bacterium]
MATIFIPKKYCGPPDSGNGGYTCGLLSAALKGPSEVTLRMPIPIEKIMRIDFVDPKHAHLKSGDDLVAEGVRFELEPTSAPTVNFEQAQEATDKSPAFVNHPFPTCFVCGPQRAVGDGLRIFPGPLSTADASLENLFAAPWVPDASLADAKGKIPDEIVWAALDCPTGFAGGFPYEGKLVTGRLGAKLVSPVQAGEKCVLVSWRLGVEGRKHHAAAVLLGGDGEVRAQAKATWIKLS